MRQHIPKQSKEFEVYKIQNSILVKGKNMLASSILSTLNVRDVKALKFNAE